MAEGYYSYGHTDHAPPTYLAVVARRLLQLASEAGQEAGRDDARRALELVSLLDYIWLQPVYIRLQP